MGWGKVVCSSGESKVVIIPTLGLSEVEVLFSCSVGSLLRPHGLHHAGFSFIFSQNLLKFLSIEFADAI